jgi:DNA-3-methyladenine glycosylase I
MMAAAGSEGGEPAGEPTGRANGGPTDRCAWAVGPWLTSYHDDEWGVPVHDDARHFEFLVLEGAQAGLSWLTILKRREGYRRAFADFDPAAVARFTDADIERLVADTAVIRNRRKLESAVHNARVFTAVQAEFGSFDAYLWAFVDGRPIVNHWTSPEEVPASTPLSDAVASDMRRRGFRFVGPTVCYSHLQAAGLVNDHLTSCPRHAVLAAPPVP